MGQSTKSPEILSGKPIHITFFQVNTSYQKRSIVNVYEVFTMEANMHIFSVTHGSLMNMN